MNRDANNRRPVTGQPAGTRFAHGVKARVRDMLIQGSDVINRDLSEHSSHEEFMSHNRRTPRPNRNSDTPDAC